MHLLAKSTAISMPQELELHWLHMKPAEAFSCCTIRGCNHCVSTFLLCKWGPLSGYAIFGHLQLMAQRLCASLTGTAVKRRWPRRLCRSSRSLPRRASQTA